MKIKITQAVRRLFKAKDIPKVKTQPTHNKVIIFGVGFFDVKEDKKVTHNITHIHVDSFSGVARVVIQKGQNIHAVNISMQHAQDIGFINVKALAEYCN